MEKQERRPDVGGAPQGKEEVKANPKVAETGKKLKEDIDKLVDEIDDVLEKTPKNSSRITCKKGESNALSLDTAFPPPRRSHCTFPLARTLSD